MQPPSTDDPLITAFLQGQLFVYPTEAVIGLGCDPDNQAAVMKLLALKRRPAEKGLILVAKTYAQLLPYVEDSAIPMDRRTQIFSSWPGPNTWLLPKSSQAPAWISGDSELVAVRVSANATVQELCARLNKPLVSTSANLAGQAPARTIAQARDLFDCQGLIFVEGEVDGDAHPSCIRNGLNGQLIRAS